MSTPCIDSCSGFAYVHSPTNTSSLPHRISMHHEYFFDYPFLLVNHIEKDGIAVAFYASDKIMILACLA